MMRFMLCASLLLAVFVAGCSSPTPSAGEPKPLPGKRIPPRATQPVKK